MDTTFIADLSGPCASFPHFWEHTIGSGHATLALRADWRRQLLRSHRELGFGHVRFHGILSDDMGTLIDESDQLIYSFFNADQVMDFLLSIGMAPFAELSFMPLALSSGGQTVFNYKGNVTPPKDYTAWKELISTIAAQVAQLETVSSLTREALTLPPDNGARRLDIEIPPQGTALITLETA